MICMQHRNLDKEIMPEKADRNVSESFAKYTLRNLRSKVHAEKTKLSGAIDAKILEDVIGNDALEFESTQKKEKESVVKIRERRLDRKSVV